MMKTNGQNFIHTPVEYEMNKATLTFASLKEENEYREAAASSGLILTRLSIAVSILLYLCYIFLRYQIFTEFRTSIFIIQDLVFFLPAITLFILSFFKFFGKITQINGMLLFLASGITIITSSIIWPVQHSLFTIGLVIATLYGYLFFRLRFIYASMIGWALLIFVLIATISNPDRTVTESGFQFAALILANLVGMVGAYAIEFLVRRNFYLNKAFYTEKTAHEKLINELEQKSKDSTDLQKFKEGLEANQANLELANSSLSTRIQIVELLKDTANQFLKIDQDDIDVSINTTLQKIAEYVKVDRGYIYLLTKNDTSLFNTNIWCAKGIEQKIKNHEGVDHEDFKWLMQRLQKPETVIVNSVNQLPEQASSIHSIFSVEGVQSFIISPLTVNGKLIGLLGLDSVKLEKVWEEEHVYLLEKAAVIFVNVLERKKTIWNARRSEDKLSALIERTDDVVFITTPEGKILDINPAGAKLFGYPTVNAILQETIDERFFANPDDRKNYQKIMEKEGQVRGYELVLKRKDGKRVVVLETAKAVKNDDGKVLAYEGIMRDVTEQRQLERQFFQSQKMESIGLLAGGIAHDFNNIVTAINGYADMILMSLDKDHPQYKNVVNILKGGKRAEKLTRQLLAFSRKQIIKPKIVNINIIISELAKMLSRLIGEDIIFETELNNDISNIKADPGQIQQVLVNLVVNARDAINDLRDKHAEKKIVIKTDETELDTKFVLNHPGSSIGKHIVISVSDTGIGISDEIKTKVFEPFFTTKEEGRGTGLGLSTVYGIVKQNNSSIYMESMPGNGTIFYVYWPVSREEKITTTSEETTAVQTKQKATVLVVEDDDNVRELACSFLKSLGYNIMEAEDGLKAMEIINGNNTLKNIDLLLTDIVMPGMRGDELAERVKKMRPGIKIILTSGYTDSDIIQGGIGNEAFNFLPKPYTIKQMAKKIEKVLENGKLQN
jgi:two-component system cell cycle sensor histidine kinase/response regulator CckA